MPEAGAAAQALSKSDKEVLWARDRLASVGSQPPQGLSQLAQHRLRDPMLTGAFSYPGPRQLGSGFSPSQLAASRQYAVCSLDGRPDVTQYLLAVVPLVLLHVCFFDMHVGWPGGDL